MKLTKEQEKARELYSNYNKNIRKLNEQKYHVDITKSVEIEDAVKWLKSTNNISLEVLYDAIYDITKLANFSKSKYLKSVLAYCKLLVIVEALNEGWEVIEGYTIAYDFGINENEFYIHYTSTKKGNILLKSTGLAQHLIDNFSDLLKEYFMID